MKFSFPFRITAAAAVLSLCAAFGAMASAQSAAQSTIHPGKTPAPRPEAPPPHTKTPAKKPDSVITAQQAKELFASVDQIMRFDSRDSGLPIKHPVKRKLTTRADVEKYLESKLKNGKDSKRMMRSAIILKKFGLLPQNFDLGPFMVKLLKEQIAGYYDSKTKTVYMLNWIAPKEQKPVLAHELMHALQDQYVNLQKWGNKSLDGISRNVTQDNRHIRVDEDDTARQAVLEGQAMVTYIDYALAPHGISIAQNPDFILNHLSDLTDDTKGSPVMASAPRVLRESLIFPYREGLRFEIELLRDEGKRGAFADTLNNPPSSTYQVMDPAAYESHAKVPVLTLPNVHPLLDRNYRPYDVGVMGELDARMLLQLTTSDSAANRIASHWDGGIYFVAQKKHAANKNSTASVALFYLSHWRNRGAARLFAKNYEAEVLKKYPHSALQSGATTDDHVYTTDQGPVLITISGRYVFVSESFPLNTARKLNFMLLGAQHALAGEETAAYQPAYPDLTGALSDFAQRAGILRTALPPAGAFSYLQDRRSRGIYTDISVESHPWSNECNRQK